MKNKLYFEEDAKGMDFSGESLEETVFEGCDLSHTIFKNANLRGAKFIGCYTTKKKESLKKQPQNLHVSFEGSDLHNATFKRCAFNGVNLEKARLTNTKIENCVFSAGILNGANLNGAFINDLDISFSELNFSSFINAHIIDLKHTPKRITLFKRVTQIKETPMQTIFTDEGSPFDFREYCLLERRKDLLFKFSYQKPRLIRPIAIAITTLFGILTNFGTSFSRWLFCASIFILSFSFLMPKNIIFPEKISMSIMAFFNIGEIPDGIKNIFICETIIGYFMLGILISLVSSKINS